MTAADQALVASYRPSEADVTSEACQGSFDSPSEANYSSAPCLVLTEDPSEALEACLMDSFDLALASEAYLDAVELGQSGLDSFERTVAVAAAEASEAFQMDFVYSLTSVAYHQVDSVDLLKASEAFRLLAVVAAAAAAACREIVMTSEADLVLHSSHQLAEELTMVASSCSVEELAVV